MEQEILTENQRLVIKTIAEDKKLKNFYLSGGTALAAYFLHHRFSDDLDFFSEKEFDRTYLHKFIEKLKNVLGAKKVEYQKLYDRNIFIFKLKNEDLKVEFTEYPFSILAKQSKKDDITVDSFRDVAANKLMALLDRFDPKDFVDLYFILKERRLDSVRKDTEKKFGIKIDNIFLGGELSKVRRIEALPKMIKPVTVEKLKDFFSKQSQDLKDSVLG